MQRHSHQQTYSDTLPGALAVLADPALWRTITPFMSGWLFAIVCFYQQRVATCELHSQEPKTHVTTFPQDRRAVP